MRRATVGDVNAALDQLSGEKKQDKKQAVVSCIIV